MDVYQGKLLIDRYQQLQLSGPGGWASPYAVAPFATNNSTIAGSNCLPALVFK